MDPFTITTIVLRITGSCVSAAHTLWEIREAWKRAPVTVSTLCSQLKITAASLSQIQSLLLSDTDVLRDKPDLVETFDTTLTSCMVLATLLEKYVQKIKVGALEGTRATWKMRFNTIWREGEVKEILQQLSAQQEAIGVLVNLLQMDSMSEIRRLVRQHDTLLREIAANTRAARKSHSIDVPASVLEPDDASESVFDRLVDTPNDEEAEFEMAIMSSKVYTKAFTGVLGPTTDEDDDSDDAPTVVNLEPISCLMEIEKLVKVVQPHRVMALCYKPAGPGLDPDEILMRDVIKLSTDKYQGRKFDKDTGFSPRSDPREDFDRHFMVLQIWLEFPVKIRALRDTELQQRTSKYSTGELFTIKECLELNTYRLHLSNLNIDDRLPPHMDVVTQREQLLLRENSSLCVSFGLG